MLWVLPREVHFLVPRTRLAGREQLLLQHGPVDWEEVPALGASCPERAREKRIPNIGRDFSLPLWEWFFY